MEDLKKVGKFTNLESLKQIVDEAKYIGEFEESNDNSYLYINNASTLYKYSVIQKSLESKNSLYINKRFDIITSIECVEKIPIVFNYGDYELINRNKPFKNLQQDESVKFLFPWIDTEPHIISFNPPIVRTTIPYGEISVHAANIHPDDPRYYINGIPYYKYKLTWKITGIHGCFYNINVTDKESWGKIDLTPHSNCRHKVNISNNNLILTEN